MNPPEASMHSGFEPPSRAESIAPRTERRCERRMPLGGSFAMARLSADGVLAPTEEAGALDLSCGGIRLRVLDTASPGDSAVLQLLDGSGTPKLVGVKVIHCFDAPDGSRVLGARFTTLPTSVVRRSLMRAEGGVVDLRQRSHPPIRAAG